VERLARLSLRGAASSTDDVDHLRDKDVDNFGVRLQRDVPAGMAKK
jgi:hypothetical protein